MAVKCTKSVYKGKIHDAILRNGPNDPYTGEALRWDLIGKWDNTPGAAGSVCGRYGALSREFYLLPTVDHSNPYSDELEFEICSWLVNTSKNLMRPEEYVALCRKVSAHNGKQRPENAT